MTFERRQGRHDANHGVLLFTPLDCGLVKYYIVAEGRTHKRKVLDTKTIVHERRKNGAINKTKRVHGKGKSGRSFFMLQSRRTYAASVDIPERIHSFSLQRLINILLQMPDIQSRHPMNARSMKL